MIPFRKIKKYYKVHDAVGLTIANIVNRSTRNNLPLIAKMKFYFSAFSNLVILLSICFTTQSSSSEIIQLPQSILTLSVTDYGAVGDGVHYDTPYIQAAVNDCHALGGGHVIFPPGRYLTATIFLKSGVVLEVQENATILGGTKQRDYPAENSRWYVVVAEDAENVGITGGGEINGQGLKFVKRFDERKNVMVSWNTSGACLGDECRPRLVGFLRSKNVRVWNVNLIQPAYWW